MNINPTATQPNFKAKVKNNDYMQSYVKNAGFFEKRALKKSLEKLNDVYPNDVLEINENFKEDKFVVKNNTRNTESKFKSTTLKANSVFEETQWYDAPVKLSKIIRAIAEPGTDEHKAVFGITQKDEKSAESRADKEIFDMLA